MKRPVVSVIMGSDSDLPIMKGAIDILKKFGISHEVKVLSAHRSPKEVSLFAGGARLRGIKVIIAGAGGAAHLAGVIASITTVPVIAPIDNTPFFYNNYYILITNITLMI